MQDKYSTRKIIIRLIGGTREGVFKWTKYETISNIRYVAIKQITKTKRMEINLYHNNVGEMWLSINLYKNNTYMCNVKYVNSSEFKHFIMFENHIKKYL